MKMGCPLPRPQLDWFVIIDPLLLLPASRWLRSSIFYPFYGTTVFLSSPSPRLFRPLSPSNPLFFSSLHSS